MRTSLGQFKPTLGLIPVPLALIPVPPALIPVPLARNPVPLARNPVPPALLKRGSGPWPDFECRTATPPLLWASNGLLPSTLMYHEFTWRSCVGWYLPAGVTVPHWLSTGSTKPCLNGLKSAMPSYFSHPTRLAKCRFEIRPTTASSARLRVPRPC